MSREDYEIFKDRERHRRERRARRLNNTSDFGWSKHTDTHWYRMIGQEKMHWWPSSNKWLYKGRYYRGALPKELLDLIESENKRLQKRA